MNDITFKVFGTLQLSWPLMIAPLPALPAPKLIGNSLKLSPVLPVHRSAFPFEHRYFKSADAGASTTRFEAANAATVANVLNFMAYHLR
jgi:hypothetical protein